jgi:predicted transcriptional regulator
MNERFLTITLQPDWKGALCAIAQAAQGKGELSVRELARIVGRDVKRVHEDIGVLTNLGLLERTESGGVICPYASMHIDMYMKAA